MSKRDFLGDPNDIDEGPTSKMRKIDDSDDGGGVGRSGRVRKKSAKVLEMEEFEQAEKSTSVTKKTKTLKAVSSLVSDMDSTEGLLSSTKSKAATSAIGMMLDSTPVSRKPKKEAPSTVEGVRSLPAELSLRTPQNIMISSVDGLSHVQVEQTVKQEVPSATSLLSSVMSAATTVKQEENKSVIKYLLSSPVPGAKHQISPGFIQTSPQERTDAVAPPKKASKKIRFDDKNPSSAKPKERKMKIEIMSPSELGPPSTPVAPMEPKAPSLKMKIMSGSNPLAAQVSMESNEGTAGPTPKGKKVAKKLKTPVDIDDDLKLQIASDGDEEKVSKKKKVSKRKEKLIQFAINAAKQMPGLAASGASPPSAGDSPSPVLKPSKKKTKSPALVKKEETISDSLVMDFDDPEMEEEDEAGESTLVIAETEKKKKKSLGKKKVLKENEESPKSEKVKKIPKRAPTAYMLFCNTHRPTIVAENPGIEFASISRKLGELWQTQSNKQKLQWRRKAQRRMKKSNLISTGKVGKESQAGPSASAATSVNVQGTAAMATTNQKLALMLQKNKPVMALDEGPLSPAKVGIDSGQEHDSFNFSIEPLDVAAHLKLLGESLSIIGMRLQEHKGMIAVQGSLSVLLDSLLCACGPLLCLTQQVPGMDGCSPSVHAQTLDSVAYVMPGL